MQLTGDAEDNFVPDHLVLLFEVTRGSGGVYSVARLKTHQMARGMGYSRSENFGELHFLAGYSTLQAFQGLSRDRFGHLLDQTGNDRKPRELASQHKFAE